jgi:hypothetical protein
MTIALWLATACAIAPTLAAAATLALFAHDPPNPPLPRRHAVTLASTILIALLDGLHAGWIL